MMHFESHCNGGKGSSKMQSRAIYTKTGEQTIPLRQSWQKTCLLMFHDSPNHFTTVLVPGVTFVWSVCGCFPLKMCLCVCVCVCVCACVHVCEKHQ